MLFLDRAWPWQATAPWLLAMVLAPLAVLCWQWGYWWVLQRMGAAGPAARRAFHWSLAPLWLGALGLLLFYLNDTTHHLLCHVALPRILAMYTVVGVTLCLQVWVLDTAPALERWPPLRFASLFRKVDSSREPGKAPEPLTGAWRQVARFLRAHGAFVLLLLAGLGLRLRDILHEGGDVAHFYLFASTVFTDIHFLFYHMSRGVQWAHSFTHNQLATFILIMAPFWRAAFNLDWPQILAIKIPTYTADALSATVVYVLALQGFRRFSEGKPESAGKRLVAAIPGSAPLTASIVALVAAGAWYLHPWLLTATVENAQTQGVALLFFVLAVARWEKPWLCGIFLALAASTRLDFGIAGIVAFCWYLRWRGVRDAGLYALTSVGLLGLVAVPYAAADFAAFRWALGGQLLELGEPLHLAQEVFRALGAAVPAWLETLDNRYVGLANALFAMLVMFDPNHRRALAKAGLFYIITLPVIHVRYLIFGWAALLLFALPSPLRLLFLGPVLLLVSLPIPRLLLLGTFCAVFVALFFTRDGRANSEVD